jgi:radical SAM family uncharacterized protein/radical SAM-linked protein
VQQFYYKYDSPKLHNMAIKSIQDILPLVDNPSRYLGTEVNTPPKNLAESQLKMALAFPDLYEIGTSHFGMQILYHILNQHSEIAAERVYAPAEDMEAQLRAAALPLVSLESRYPLKQFDIIGFSLLYELNYTNMLNILDLAGIPLYASQRTDSDPIIIAGGPCVSNPEPIASFFDAIVIGEGEQVILEMTDIWLQLSQGHRPVRQALLEKWLRLESVYVPALYDVSYDSNGLQHTQPALTDQRQPKAPETIKRAIIGDINSASFPDRPLIPFGKPVHDRLRLEIARGCTRGCRFCQAGMIYRPVRERSINDLLALSASCLRQTGYEDLSLLSLSTSDYSQISPLIHALMQRFSSEHISVSLPSFRAGTLAPELMQAIRKVRKTGFTIAPEAGTQRLRDVINKNISTQEIQSTVRNAFAAGWRVIKLYFMVGLPTETQADVQGIVDLVKHLRKIKGDNGRFGKLNVSVATFIPKPHTPFQWASQLSLEESRDRIDWLREQLRLPGVQFKWQNPEVSFLEGLWARGDRRLSKLLICAFENGCRFDGWSDRFDFAKWQQSFADAAIDVDFYMRRQKELSEPLPWDHIDVRVDKTFLIDEWHRAIEGHPTDDCRQGECQQCGVCDFETRLPVMSSPPDQKSPAAKSQSPASTQSTFKFKLVYRKSGQARFFGHLELANIMTRAFRRANIPLVYSKGFHPMPKLSFADPLPIGMVGLNEVLFVAIRTKMACDEVVRRMNQELPEGLLINDCQLVKDKQALRVSDVDAYRVVLQEGEFNQQRLDQFLECQSMEIHYTTKKGVSKSMDLKNAVLSIDLVEPNRLQLSIRNHGGKRIRPAMVLQRVFNLTDDQIRRASVIKGDQYV